MSEEKKLISKEDFYFNTGLYNEIKIKDIEENLFYGEVDGFSPKNKIESTFNISIDGIVNFKIKRNKLNDKLGIYYLDNTIFSSKVSPIYKINLLCKRKSEIIYFFVKIDNEKGIIIKVGQYPSIEDIVSSKEENKYKKILGNDRINFKKATGLFSHGIGIGSYVYLRRIFENSIIDTYEKNKNKIEIDGEFKDLRMKDKIDKIKDYLPKLISDNPKIYGIISRGIHELNEEECLEYFPLLRSATKIILDQKIEIKEKEKKEKEIQKQLAALNI